MTKSKVKHNPDAKRLIDQGISEASPEAQAICRKLREIILKAEPAMIEDWKWGPNYYKDGMVCGFWHFKSHVTLTFFQGALLKDKKKILQKNEGTLHNRHIKFRSVDEIDEDLLTRYIAEAVINNEKGLKIVQATDKTVRIPADFRKLLSSHKLLANFEGMTYSRRKDYVLWIESAKQEETRNRRMEQAIIKIRENTGLNDKYMKPKKAAAKKTK